MGMRVMPQPFLFVDTYLATTRTFSIRSEVNSVELVCVCSALSTASISSGVGMASRADFQIEVLNSKGESLGKLNIPFALSSSTAPEQNNPSDAEAASAFANVAKVLTTTNPICGIQLQYTGDSEGMFHKMTFRFWPAARSLCSLPG